jgi:hypothetical protein
VAGFYCIHTVPRTYTLAVSTLPLSIIYHINIYMLCKSSSTAHIVCSGLKFLTLPFPTLKLPIHQLISVGLVECLTSIQSTHNKSYGSFRNLSISICMCSTPCMFTRHTPYLLIERLLCMIIA